MNPQEVFKKIWNREVTKEEAETLFANLLQESFELGQKMSNLPNLQVSLDNQNK